MIEPSRWSGALQPPDPFSRNDYDLQPVFCPGTWTRKDGRFGACTKLIDRREVLLDGAVHEYKCPHCSCLYTYRFSSTGDVVVLSMQHPPAKRGHE